MKTRLAVALSVFLFGVELLAQGEPLRPIDDPDSYQVYGALLPSEWLVTVAGTKEILVQRETKANWSCTFSAAELGAEWQAALANFRLENASMRAVLPGFSLSLPYRVATRREIKATIIMAPQGLQVFHRRYPEAKGYIAVSAVGFDPERVRAVVYVEHWCGALCGGGRHHFLEKTDGRWREMDHPEIRFCEWQS